MPIDRDRALAVVRASPAAVRAHDKQAWLDLFAESFTVCDPVGGVPVTGTRGDRDGLSRFWDAYIASRAIEIGSIAPDIACDNTVVRDVTIRITDSANLTISTAAHLRYDLLEEGGRVRIASLAAHWEPWPVLAQLARPRAANVRSAIATTRRLLKYQGISGAIGFAGAIRNTGRPGRAAVREYFARSTEPGLFPGNKWISAGTWVTVSCTGNRGPGVAFFEIDRKTRKVRDFRIYD